MDYLDGTLAIVAIFAAVSAFVFAITSAIAGLKYLKTYAENLVLADYTLKDNQDLSAMKAITCFFAYDFFISVLLLIMNM